MVNGPGRFCLHGFELRQPLFVLRARLPRRGRADRRHAGLVADLTHGHRRREAGGEGQGPEAAGAFRRRARREVGEGRAHRRAERPLPIFRQRLLRGRLHAWRRLSPLLRRQQPLGRQGAAVDSELPAPRGQHRFVEPRRRTPRRARAGRLAGRAGRSVLRPGDRFAAHRGRFRCDTGLRRRRDRLASAGPHAPAGRRDVPRTTRPGRLPAALGRRSSRCSRR